MSHRHRSPAASPRIEMSRTAGARFEQMPPSMGCRASPSCGGGGWIRTETWWSSCTAPGTREHSSVLLRMEAKKPAPRDNRAKRRRRWRWMWRGCSRSPRGRQRAPGSDPAWTAARFAPQPRCPPRQLSSADTEARRFGGTGRLTAGLRGVFEGGFQNPSPRLHATARNCGCALMPMLMPEEQGLEGGCGGAEGACCAESYLDQQLYLDPAARRACAVALREAPPV